MSWRPAVYRDSPREKLQHRRDMMGDKRRNGRLLIKGRRWAFIYRRLIRLAVSGRRQ